MYFAGKLGLKLMKMTDKVIDKINSYKIISFDKYCLQETLEVQKKHVLEKFPMDWVEQGLMLAQSLLLLCRLKRRHIGYTFVGVSGVVGIRISLSGA